MVGYICTVGYYATQTPCAGVKSLVAYLVQQVLLPTLVQGLTWYIHNDWDRRVDCGSESLLAFDEVSPDCKVITTIIAPWFPSTSQQALDFVMPHLSATQQALENYQRAVGQLAEAAKSAD